jgi:hypothetical protein
MMRLRFSIVATFGCCLIATSVQAQESSDDILAAHLRVQGYKCDAPKNARRDARASRPGEAVWLIDCANAHYRVRLVPDMADVIEPYATGVKSRARR